MGSSSFLGNLVNNEKWSKVKLGLPEVVISRPHWKALYAAKKWGILITAMSSIKSHRKREGIHFIRFYFSCPASDFVFVYTHVPIARDNTSRTVSRLRSYLRYKIAGESCPATNGEGQDVYSGSWLAVVKLYQGWDPLVVAPFVGELVKDR